MGTERQYLDYQTNHDSLVLIRLVLISLNNNLMGFHSHKIRPGIFAPILGY